MNDTDINDKRTMKEFQGISFSNFKKTAVKKELLNSLENGKIEPACYWSSELICAGHYSDLWDIIINFASKYIHLGNPKLPIYIHMRFDNFKNIVHNGYIDNELSMRNNSKIRQLFAEIISVLCSSNKKHRLESIKIKKEEFDMTQITSRLKAPSVTFIESVFMKSDPKELFIAMNEFAYHISKKSLQAVNACYWIEWIIEFESICKKKKEPCFCERRSFAPVDEKMQMDVIWMIWDSILQESKKRKQSKMLSKILESLLHMFSIRYSSGVKKRRRYILYFAVLLITESININIDIISNKPVVENIIKKIDIIYKQVKKNEVSPNTDYLYTNVGKSNLEKTIEKLDKMNHMNSMIPRKD